MQFNHDEFGLMQCPQPYQWKDAKGDLCRGVMTWAEGEEHAIRRRVVLTKNSRTGWTYGWEYLMATACSRKLVWVREEKLEVIPFRSDDP